MKTMEKTLDPTRLEAFMGRALVDLAAAESAVTNYLGDRLGLYRALASAESMTASELAAATGTNERLVLEWLRNQTAGEYVDHDAGRFSLPPEHAAALVDTDSPYYIAGAFDILASVWADTRKIELAFLDDGGLEWGEHDHRLYEGVERFYAPGYRVNLVSTWLPALEGMVDRLDAGALVADVGCGYGVSTVIMAEAFPKSRFVGSDPHKSSIDAATMRAEEAGVDDRVRFELEAADDLTADGYDLICFFDALHDMGDPVSAASAARRALSADGVVMVVEPRAGDDLDANINPVGRMFYAGSTLLCTPSALSQNTGSALGAQAGPAVLTRVLREAGFENVKVVAETAFNLVLEAK